MRWATVLFGNATVSVNYYLFVTICWQNYFGDPWNVLDFVIVVGSITDIVAGRVLVSEETLATPSVH